MARQLDNVMRDQRKARAVEAYAFHGTLEPACEAAGVSRATVRNWRIEDPDFKAAMDDALEKAVDAAEDELRSRAMGLTQDVVRDRDGTPIYRRDPQTGSLILDGEFNPIPYTKPVRSDRLLEIYLKARRKEFRDRSGIELTGPDGGPVTTAITVKFVDADGGGKPAPDPFD